MPPTHTLQSTYIYNYVNIHTLVGFSGDVTRVEKGDQQRISRLLHPSLGVVAGSVGSFPCNQQILAQKQNYANTICFAQNLWIRIPQK